MIVLIPLVLQENTSLACVEGCVRSQCHIIYVSLTIKLVIKHFEVLRELCNTFIPPFVRLPFISIITQAYFGIIII